MLQVNLRTTRCHPERSPARFAVPAVSAGAGRSEGSAFLPASGLNVAPGPSSPAFFLPPRFRDQAQIHAANESAHHAPSSRAKPRAVAVPAVCAGAERSEGSAFVPGFQGLNLAPGPSSPAFFLPPRFQDQAQIHAANESAKRRRASRESRSVGLKPRPPKDDSQGRHAGSSSSSAEGPQEAGASSPGVRCTSRAGFSP